MDPPRRPGARARGDSPSRSPGPRGAEGRREWAAPRRKPPRFGGRGSETARGLVDSRRPVPVGLVRTAVPFVKMVPYPVAFGALGQDAKRDNHLTAPGSEGLSLAVRTRPRATPLGASTGIRVHPPMGADVAGEVPAGSRLIRLQLLYRFGEHIPHDLDEHLRRGVYKNRQLLDASSRRHNRLSTG